MYVLFLMKHVMLGSDQCPSLV